MKKFITTLILSIPALVFAEIPDCNGYNAFLLSGTIISTPTFHSGKYQDKVELSHTIFNIRADDGSGDYQVSVDNVFANDYDQSSGASIPNSYLNAFQVNNDIQLCGEQYTSPPQGIHWVHTNCGDNSSGPTGYAIINGVNLTNNQEYCSLWPN